MLVKEIESNSNQMNSAAMEAANQSLPDDSILSQIYQNKEIYLVNEMSALRFPDPVGEVPALLLEGQGEW